MRKTAILLGASLFLSFFLAGSADAVNEPLTLDSAYQMALQQSETLAIEGQGIHEAQARFYRSLDNFLPSVSFRVTRLERDVEDGAVVEEGILGDSRRRVTPEEKIVFSQPIFSGFKEIAALRATGADKKQQKAEMQRAKELLFIDVAEAYYAVLETDRQVEVLNAVQKLMSERLGDIDERVKLGRSREADRKTSVADLRLIEADLIEAKATAHIARRLLEFYIGRSLEDCKLADDAVGSPEDVTPDEEKEAASRRSDVYAAEQGYRVAQEAVVSARAGFFPSVTLDGNYYTRRVGSQDGNDWDVTLTADVPLFDAGQTFGDVKEAAADREVARLDYELALRMARLDIQNARENWVMAAQSAEALDRAQAAAKENVDLLVGEYGLNLVNNLDVLDALRRYQDILSRFNAAHYRAKKNFWKFKVALGEAL